MTKNPDFHWSNEDLERITLSIQRLQQAMINAEKAAKNLSAVFEKLKSISDNENKKIDQKTE